MYFSISMTGAAEIEKKLLGMERKVAQKLVKKTLREATNAIASQAKTNASTKVGGGMGALIAENIIVKPARRQKKFSYQFLAMIKSLPIFVHMTKAGIRHYIPAAIEYGHAFPYSMTVENPTGSEIARIDAQIKRNVGKRDVRAIPFFRPAFDETKGLAQKIIESGIREAVESK